MARPPNVDLQRKQARRSILRCEKQIGDILTDEEVFHCLNCDLAWSEDVIHDLAEWWIAERNRDSVRTARPTPSHVGGANG